MGVLLLSVGIGTSIYSTEIVDKSTEFIRSFSTRSYGAKLKEGVIGVTKDIPVDNPADNLFHIRLEEGFRNQSVWLVYELSGVEDHTAVSRSINDQLAVGGYLVKKRQGWRKQREQLDASWLRKGDNVVRFTLPQGASHSYRVRNVAIEVANESQTVEKTLVINQPQSLSYYQNKAYLKGFVADSGNKPVKVLVDGKIAKVFNGEFESLLTKPNGVSSWKVQVEAIYPDGQSLYKEVSFSQALSADQQFTLQKEVKRVEKVVATGKAATLALPGASLQAASGALRTAAALSITTLRAVDVPALDPGMVNVTKESAGFRFLPHGSRFAKEVDLHVAYDPEKIPEGYTEKDIKTYFFDEASHHWVALPTDTVLTQTLEVWSKTTHFTDMINGIIKVPESPDVQAYTSTSMKGIKAANPTAAVNLLAPPSANSTGSASMTYPLNLPAGRNGIQPEVSISYNSEGDNSWMGLGWNLAIPAISLDTRWGAPVTMPLKKRKPIPLKASS